MKTTHAAAIQLFGPASAAPSDELLADNPGLSIQHILLTPELVAITLAGTAERAACPLCGQTSARIHSHYQRILADLPCHGRRVRLLVCSRRFFCTTADCTRQIFVERFPRLAAAGARTTARLGDAHTSLGLALGGEAGARLARHLAMATSPDTLLRRVKASSRSPAAPPRVIGIDDWAWRKGQRYGTILADLERGRVLDLLPDRESTTLQAWLRDRPGIEIICRDRSGAYAQAASAAAPQAKQVADRWHLLQNLRETVERLFARSYGKIRRALTPSRPATADQDGDHPAGPAAEGPVGSVPLSRRQQAQQARRARRVERYERVRQLHQAGYSVRQIALRMDLNDETVRRYLRMDQCPTWQPRRPRPVALDGYRAWIDQRLREGRRNAVELHRELADQGQAVSYFAVQRFVRRRLAALGAPRPKDRLRHRRPRLPSARQLAFVVIRRPERRSAQEQGQLGAIRQIDEELQGALQMAEGFAAMLRKTSAPTLPAWLTEAERSECVELRGFAGRLRQDEAAVTAAMTEKWSSGPVEGNVNRLKTIKRQMYGRAGFQLLRARVVNAA